MNWRRVVDPVFPIVEPLDAAQAAEDERRLEADLAAIEAADWGADAGRALEQAQRIAAAEEERIKAAESKATTYLAVLAALVPIVLTIQAASWERKAGPAPEWLKMLLLAVATAYVAAAGLNAFRALQVSAYARIGEGQLVSAWRSPRPLHRLARETLIATRRSRDAVNRKVTRILVTHAHLIRAFAAFSALLLLDPAFYAVDALSGAARGTATSARTGAPVAKAARPPARSSMSAEPEGRCIRDARGAGVGAVSAGDASFPAGTVRSVGRKSCPRP